MTTDITILPQDVQLAIAGMQKKLADAKRFRDRYQHMCLFYTELDKWQASSEREIRRMKIALEWIAYDADAGPVSVYAQKVLRGLGY